MSLKKFVCTKCLIQYNYLPDAFVVEGPKAGGHLGFSMNDLSDKKHNLKTLLQEVLSVTKDIKAKYNKKIPVIAAGEITTR